MKTLIRALIAAAVINSVFATTPTSAPTKSPTSSPTLSPTAAPTGAPTKSPTAAPTGAPTAAPTGAPTAAPTGAPTAAPTRAPTAAPTAAPTGAPTMSPTLAPTLAPTMAPTPPPTTPPQQPVQLLPADNRTIYTNFDADICQYLPSSYYGWSLMQDCEAENTDLNFAWYQAVRWSPVADLIMGIFSTIGSPMLLTTFWHEQSNFNPDWSFYAAAAAYYNGGWAGLFNYQFPGTQVNAELYAYATGVIYSQIIEFMDTNNNGVYDDGTDLIVSTYNFTSATWAPMQITQTLLPDGATLYNYTAYTLNDGVFKIQYSIANSVTDWLKYALTPNMTKVDIWITYPYTTKNSLLALETIILSNNVNITLVNSTTAFYEDVIYGWNPNVTVYDNTSASETSTITSTGFWFTDTTGNYGLSDSDAYKVDVLLSSIVGNDMVYKHYPTFQTYTKKNNRVQTIYWDPYTVVNENWYYEGDDSDDSGVASTSLVVVMLSSLFAVLLSTMLM